MAPTRILTFSTLFPNGAMPRHGVFVEQRLRHLVASPEIESRVVAPVPWFPFRSPAFGGYSDYAKAPRIEVRHGIEISHPRYLVIPKFGMRLAPRLLATGARGDLQRWLSSGYDFDLIDAHYFYPDGVAAVMLARELDKPVIITARGTDINLIPKFKGPRRLIQWAANNASGIVTVCQALKDSLVDLGVDSKRISVLRNGVDLALFSPVEQAVARREIGIDPSVPVLMSAGWLIERKGHDIPLRALRELPGARLLIVGDGELRGHLEKLAKEQGVADRVTFVGGVPHDRMKLFYSAADALVLASSREGWANVLLESMACGTPVVATDIWGTPEAVAAPEAGVLMSERTPEACAAAFRELQSRTTNRAATRRYAEQFSWDATTSGQIDLMQQVAMT